MSVSQNFKTSIFQLNISDIVLQAIDDDQLQQDIPDEIRCCICSGISIGMVQTNCNHIFCGSCLSKWLSAEHSKVSNDSNYKEYENGSDHRGSCPNCKTVISRSTCSLISKSNVSDK